MLVSNIVCMCDSPASFPLLHSRGPRDRYGGGARTGQYRTVCMGADS